MEKAKIYEQLEIAAHRAYARGIQTGNGGNCSARMEGGMIVKSSGGSLADCNKEGEGFVETTLDGTVLAPEGGKPTREVFLHGLMYKIADELGINVGGVMHCHSPWAISWSYSKKALPMTTLHMQLKVGCDLPVVDVKTASVQPEDEPAIRRLFEENPKLSGFILVGHGVVALGKDILAAEHMAELFEETAQIAITKAACEKLGIY